MACRTTLILVAICFFGTAYAENYAVKGVLKCGDEPYKGAVLLLVDNDGTSEFFSSFFFQFLTLP